MAADILYIEDEASMVELVQLVLQQEGLTVQGASGGDEGLAMMRESPPKVVLLDIMLPGMDGWEVFRQMKADPALENIPVIIVTARKNQLEEVIARTRAGVDEYLTKPFSPGRMRAVVREVITAKGEGRT